MRPRRQLSQAAWLDVGGPRDGVPAAAPAGAVRRDRRYRQSSSSPSAPPPWKWPDSRRILWRDEAVRARANSSSTAPGRRPCGPAGSRESTVLRPGAPFFCSDAEPKSQIAAGHQRTANGPRQNFSNILPIDRFDSTFCRWRSRLRDVTMVCDVANTVRVPAGSLASLVRSGGSVTVSALTGRRCTCHVALRIRRCCTFFVQSHLTWPPGEQI